MTTFITVKVVKENWDLPKMSDHMEKSAKKIAHISTENKADDNTEADLIVDHLARQCEL